MKKLIIIDGYSLLFRAYYATAYSGEDNLLRTSTGFPVNAIVTFSYMLFPILQKLGKDDGIIVALDTGHKTKRHEKFPDYKANRAETPQSLKDQMPVLRELLDSLNVPHYEIIGYEADDVAGSLAKTAEQENINVEIYTSDKDYLQLVSDNISINLIKKGIKDVQNSNVDNFKELYGFTPNQLIDYKGLRGDSSDNLPGINGVGEKTAKDLLEKYADLDEIYLNIDEIKGKLKDKLIEGKDQGYMCKELATINTDLVFPFEIDSLTYQGYIFSSADEFINRYELKSFYSKLNKVKQFKSVEQDSLFDLEEENNDEEIIENNLDIFLNSKEIAVIPLYDNKNYHKSDLLVLAIYDGHNLGYLDIEYIKKYSGSAGFFANSDIKFYYYDYKVCGYLLMQNGIKTNKPSYDLTLALYMLDSSLKITIIDAYRYFGSNLTPFETDPKKHVLEAAKNLINIKNKSEKMMEEKDLLTLFYTVELPLSYVLMNMEFEGFPVNKEKLDEFGKELNERITILEKQIHEMANDFEFNISSPKQLIPVLSRMLDIPESKIKSTDVDFLKQYDDNEFIQLLLEYRKNKKLLSTYIEGIKECIYPDEKLHCIFNQSQTSTGRLSCSEPNLQNITVRTEEGKLIRKAFYYDDPNYVILSFDYSQIELRVLAHIANCKALIDAFNNGEDIHEATAKLIFNVQNVTSNQRRTAKTVNFGIVYGISDFGLANDLEIPIPEAKALIEQFFINFPEIKEYQNSTIESLEKYGYVKTIFNRTRYIPEIHNSDYRKREFAKRAGINVPIQGSAADLIKIAMIKISDLLENYDSKMINQIHDELIFKINVNELEELQPKIKEIMENVISLKVPLVVDGGYAKDWYGVK